MYQTPLIEHIFSLSNREIHDFRLWLSTPLHNSRTTLLPFFNWIIAQRNTNDYKTTLTKERAFQVIFPNKVYQEKQMRYEVFFLLQQLRQFLAWQDFQADTTQQELYLLENLQTKGLHKPFGKQFKKIKQIIDKQPYRNAAYYFQEYQLQVKAYEFSHYNNRDAKKPLQEVVEAFSVYAIANLLRWQCNILSHRVVSQREYDISFLQGILDILKLGMYEQIPVVQIYYQIYLSLDTGEEQYYDNLKANILTHFDAFPIDEMRDILLLTINFCIRKLNSGDADFLREAFEWYRKGFETQILLNNKRLSRFTYNNVVIIALKLEEFDWTKQFLEKYKDNVDALYRHDTYFFNLALWYQYQKKYDEVLKLLQKVEFKDVFQILHAKTILLRIYYELNHIKALNSLLDSIKIYLYRNKKLGYHKENYTKLIHYTQKLIRLNPYNKAAKQQLIEKVKNESGLLLKSWFLQQLE